MTRITLLSRNRNVLSNNIDNLAQVAELQERLSSGKRLRVMSDDPVSGRRSLIYRTERFEGQRFQTNIDRSLAFLNATDSSLNEMVDVLGTVKELAVEGATGTQDDASRRALAQSTQSQLERMIDLANTVHDGRYIFSGTEVLTKPFEATADGSDVTYSGNLDRFEVPISPSDNVAVNQSGYEFFKDDVDVFQVMIDLRDALNDNDPDTVDRLIERVDAVQQHVNNLHGSLGGTTQRLELTRNQLEDIDVQLGELISREEDADMAETIMNLQAAQVALEAGLQAGARVLQPTLLDYI